MAEPADTLTGSVWVDRVALAAFGLVFGVLFIRPALDTGPLGQGGIDWRALGFVGVSLVFWGAAMVGTMWLMTRVL